MAEILIGERMLVVSETDERGIITFANEDFVTMSGYTYHELIGKSHNILRHPVMPPSVFSDLWKTIRNERIWRGFICNRCKNGDHYWVHATVSPVTASDGSKHYLSIRRRPKREEVDYYSRLYATVN